MALRVGVVAASLATLSVLYASYEYSFCILLENDCHALGRAESCAALASTTRFCGLVYATAVALAAVAAAAFIVARRGVNGTRR